MRALYLATEADRPALYALVERAAESGALTGTIALETLWRLGEDPDYFATIVRAWDEDPPEVRALGSSSGQSPKHWLARAAGFMLARSPTTEYTALLDSIDVRGRREFRAQLQSGRVPTTPYPTGFNSIASEIRRVRDLQADYAALTTDAERVAFALSHATWGSTSVYDITAQIQPAGGVGHAWLREISERSPALVAAGIVSHVDASLAAWQRRRREAVREEIAAEGLDAASAEREMEYVKETIQERAAEVRLAQLRYLGAVTTPEVRALMNAGGEIW